MTAFRGLWRKPRSGRATAASSQYFIKDGYVARAEPDYFHDVTADELGIVHQPDVYPFAAHIARHYGCSRIVDLGCGRGDKLAALSPEFRIVGVDIGPNLQDRKSVV